MNWTDYFFIILFQYKVWFYLRKWCFVGIPTKVKLFDPISDNIDPDDGLLLQCDVECIYPNDIDIYLQRRVKVRVTPI